MSPLERRPCTTCHEWIPAAASSRPCPCRSLWLLVRWYILLELMALSGMGFERISFDCCYSERAHKIDKQIHNQFSSVMFRWFRGWMEGLNPLTSCRRGKIDIVQYTSSWCACRLDLYYCDSSTPPGPSQLKIIEYQRRNRDLQSSILLSHKSSDSGMTQKLGWVSKNSFLVAKQIECRCAW